MKKLFYPLVIIICCFAGCNKDEDKAKSTPSNPTEENETAKITVKVVEAGAQTEKALSADVWLVPESSEGEVESGFHDKQNGYLTFDDLSNGASYDVFTYCYGYQSRVDISAMAKIAPQENDIIPVQMTPADTTTFRFEKSIIDFGKQGSLAAANIETGNDFAVSWTIESEYKEWISFIDSSYTGSGNGSVIIRINRDYIKDHSETKSGKIIARASNGKTSELWLIVSGAGEGVNMGDIVTWNITDITINSATVSFWILDDEIKSNAQKIGIICSKKQDCSTQDGIEGTLEVKEDSSFAISISKLENGITYYAKAYTIDKNTGNFRHGNIIEFRTGSYPPEVQTPTASDINSTSAVFYSKMKNAGAPGYKTKGFVYATIQEPTIDAGKYLGKFSLNKTDEFTSKADNLKANTKYYVRTYATSSDTTIYSQTISFTTNIENTKLTVNVSNITPTSVTLEGTITKDGIPLYTERGFCWSERGTPTIDDENKMVSNYTDIANYELTVNDLEYETSYNVRAYAIQNGIPVYSDNIKTFTTIWEDTKITTSAVTQIGATTATFNGTIKDLGNPPYIEKGFCWLATSSTQYYPVPYIDDNSIPVAGTTTGDFHWDITDLPTNAAYVVRAYAIQYYDMDPIYGDEKVFSTLWTDTELGAPTITDLGIGTAKLSATIINEGIPAYSECGFCYIKERIQDTDGYDKEATINDNKIIISEGDDFEYEMTDIPELYVYWVRAYAIQGTKEIYSDVGYFISGSIPVLETGPAKNVNSTEATLQGYIKYAGSPSYTEKGFCYNYTGSPSISDNIKTVIDANKTGLFTATVSLPTNSTVYVRAYAKNDLKIAYGEEIHFTVSNYIELSTDGIAVQQIDIGSSIDYNTAVSLCNSSTVGEFYDWRVPSLEELQIIQKKRISSSIVISGIASYSSYWSSTASGGEMYILNIYDDSSKSYTDDPSETNHCRCVRTFK